AFVRGQSGTVASGSAVSDDGAACAEALCPLFADENRQETAAARTGAVSGKQADDPFYRAAVVEKSPGESAGFIDERPYDGSSAESVSIGLRRVGDQSGGFFP